MIDQLTQSEGEGIGEINLQVNSKKKIQLRLKIS